MAGILDRLRFLFTGRLSSRTAGDLRGRGGYNPQARIDAAQTTDENRKHWANADSMSADAAFDPGTRFRLRNRARYETLNNCYAKGAIKSAADDLVGTGPRLQLTIPGDADGAAGKRIEQLFQNWADETHLAMNLRTAQKSRVRDGECFGLFDSTDRLEHPVKFFVRWVEAEMCGDPLLTPAAGQGTYRVDGITFDRAGLPVEYTFYTRHPGDTGLMSFAPLDTYRLPAERVVHWLDRDRFSQHRSIPEITPALPLYSQVRRYTLATLMAAEFAAMLAGVMKTNAPAEEGQVTQVNDWSFFELVRGALLTLPQGWEATQFRPEQPTARYGEFKREVLNESGRATGQPLNVVTGNSSGYNYSSGRLDHLPYHRSLRIERNDLRLLVLNPVFRRWYREALLAGLIPDELPPIAEWSWAWNWDGFDAIDANKDAIADDTRIKNGTATYAEILAEYGQDWREVFEQLAREKAFAEKLGLPWPVLAAPPSKESSDAASQPTDKEAPEDEEERPEGEPAPESSGRAYANGAANGYHAGGRA